MYCCLKNTHLFPPTVLCLLIKSCLCPKKVLIIKKYNGKKKKERIRLLTNSLTNKFLYWSAKDFLSHIMICKVQ